MSKWISIENDLPPFGELVLVCSTTIKSIVIASREPHQEGLHWVYDWRADQQFSSVSIRDNMGYTIGRVKPNFFMQWLPTHWMQLPTAPIMEE